MHYSEFILHFVTLNIFEFMSILYAILVRLIEENENIYRGMKIRILFGMRTST